MVRRCSNIGRFDPTLTVKGALFLLTSMEVVFGKNSNASLITLPLMHSPWTRLPVEAALFFVHFLLIFRALVNNLCR